MQQEVIYIEDAIHCEQDGPFTSFDDAIAELRRRATIEWDAPPNRAPCMSWRTCGREYHILAYDARSESGHLLRQTHVLDVSAERTRWIEGYEQGWAESAE